MEKRELLFIPASPAAEGNRMDKSINYNRRIIMRNVVIAGVLLFCCLFIGCQDFTC